MKDSKAVKPGIYQHYKGGLYEVYEVATHSETLEPLVVYRPLYGEGKLWVRPLAMFCGTVSQQGQAVDRFAFVENAPQPSELYSHDQGQ